MKQTSHPFSTDHFLHGGDYNPDQWLDRPDILESILKKQESTAFLLGFFPGQCWNRRKATTSLTG